MRIRVLEAGPGLFLVMGLRTNWCLIREGDAITLVDAAWPRDYRFVVESLRRIGAGPSRVEAVVLTHAHPDHIGVAERFRADHGAAVHVHREEAGHACGEYDQHARIVDLLARMWRPSVFAFGVSTVVRGGLDVRPAAMVEAFGDQTLDVPGRLVPVPTPGHTSGHCSFHVPDRGALITGDALVNHNLLTNRPGPRLMPRIFTHDQDEAEASLQRLAGIDAGVLLPGHGSPLQMTPAEAVRRARGVVAADRWWDR